jgi:membrane dipeptidase
MKLTIALALIFLTMSMLAQPGPSVVALRKKADELAHRYIIVDGHVDLPTRLSVKNFRLTKEFVGMPIQSGEGDFDYVRARQGGLSAPFMSIYVPSSHQQRPDGGASFADSLIDMVGDISRMHPDKFAPASTPNDIERNFAEGKISLPMGMENGAPITKIADLAHFHRRGIRYITLTHGKDNPICDSSYDTTRTHNGLSPYGREVVAEMNRLGIMVDISHVSDAAFYQVIGIAKAPVIASHSSCRSYTPDFQRNMSDDMIQALGKNGGVIMINFGTTFLDGRVAKSREAMRTKLAALLESKGLKEEDEAAKPIVRAFSEENRDSLYADVEMVANHIDHAVRLAGIDHVGLGSDYDGVGDSLPTGLKDVAAYPNLLAVLLRRGYSEEDISKICYQNLFRVWREVERVAKLGH